MLESGPPQPAGEVLAWGETPQAAALRLQDRELDLRGPLHEILWRIPASPPAVAAAVHHRAFALELATELGCALPGARMIGSAAELPAGPWVLKAPLSAAGRSRHIGRDPADPAVRRLFAEHGPLLVEPWLDRVEDFGCAALALPSETRLVSIHRLRVDHRGRFTGIETHLEKGPDRTRLEEMVERVGTALRHQGYAGPFGIDAWRYRRPDGSTALHPLGEINARMTFGLVAQALAERLGLGRVRLIFGKRMPDGEDAVPLLLPGEAGGGTAWLEKV